MAKGDESGFNATGNTAARTASNLKNTGAGGSVQARHPQEPLASLVSAGAITKAQADDFQDAVNGDNGGFTKGWDGEIRAYQRGQLDQHIATDAHAQKYLAQKFNGDLAAYKAAIIKKAENCEAMIDAMPKWNGKAGLYRGFKSLTDQQINDFLDGNSMVDLNYGTASWTSRQSIADSYAKKGIGHKHEGKTGDKAMIAHVVGTRRGTSVKNISGFKKEYEVMCSKREAFRCIGYKWVGNVCHAEFEIVSTDFDWNSI